MSTIGNQIKGGVGMGKNCELCGQETSFFKGGADYNGKYLCMSCHDRKISEDNAKSFERERRVFKCIYCGSENIQKQVTPGTLQHGVGLKYGSGLCPSIEHFLVDLCKDCGSVRLYVRETEKDWL